MFAEDDGRVHAVYYLRGGDVAFYAGDRQVEGGSSPGVDTEEVRFTGFRSDQGGSAGEEDGSKWGEAVELLQILYQIHERRLDLLLKAYRSYEGWQVRTRDQETHCLRRRLSVVAEAWEKEGGGGTIGSEVIRTTLKEDCGCDEVDGNGASPLIYG